MHGKPAIGVRRWTVAIIVVIGLAAPGLALDLYVAPDGSDANPGTKDKPVATIQRARDMARGRRRTGATTIYLRGGTYRLTQPVAFGAADSGTADTPLTVRNFLGEKVTISGAAPLEADWQPHRDGILKTKVAALPFDFDQLYVDGRRQRQARWPNHKIENGIDGGFASGLVPDSGNKKVHPPPRYQWLTFKPDNFTRKPWPDAERAVIHIFQSDKWGNMQWRLTKVDHQQHRIYLGEGGWQMGTLWFGVPCSNVLSHSQYFIENVFAELDAPGEWYYDPDTRMLYFMPPAGLDMTTAKVEAGGIKRLFVLKGKRGQPVRHIRLQGLTLTRTRRTMLEPYETRLRGDWAISRNAAVFIEGAEDCAVSDCHFTDLGGNGVFVSNYCRRVDVSDSLFNDLGDSAVCLVGSDDSVRNIEVQRVRYAKLDDIDLEPGPLTPDHPAKCTIHNNLMFDLGFVGKQTAGVYLSAAADITVSHNTIGRIPRAAICINDGCFGGHLIESNDVFATVRETSDHGPFNSWGRDRFWQSLHREGKPCDMSRSKALSRLDNHRPTVIRHNRFAHPTADPTTWSGGVNSRRSHSWGIDLDDGSSNYVVDSNLGLGCAVKLREGYYRTVVNNIFVGPFAPNKHAGFPDSGDVLVRNIFVNTSGAGAFCGGPAIRYKPREMDYNLYHILSGKPPAFFADKTFTSQRRNTLEQWQALGMDTYSIVADPLFIDSDNGDYRVREGSPALKLGFKNFPMDRFGTQKAEFAPLIRKVKDQARSDYPSN